MKRWNDGTMRRWNDVAVDIERHGPFFLWSKDEPMTPHKQAAKTKAERDAATAQLFKGAPKAAKLQSQARTLQRQKARQDWWQKNKS